MRPILLVCSSALFVLPLGAQPPSRFATRVVQFSRGTGGGTFVEANVLGHPKGGGYFGGASHVLSLGDGGSVTLAFDVVITDGPGTDFTVAENPFFAGASFATYTEPCFVEVSTDGVRFARFPTRYSGPQAHPGPFDPFPIGVYAGFAGSHPVLANDLTRPGIDPYDPAVSGGDAFDLALLRGDPLVRSGAVLLPVIRYVRLVDVVSGVDRDSSGALVFAVAGSADVDSVTVVQHLGNVAPRGPRVFFEVAPGSRLALRIEDPDGISDLDPATLHASLIGLTLPFDAMLTILPLISADSQGFTLTANWPLPSGFPFTLAASARARGGDFSADRFAAN
jgi:hypothetical protein